MSIHNLLSRAKELFIQPEDQAKLKALEDSVYESDSIRIAMDSEGGKAIKKMLVTDFFTALDLLIKTREDKYISDLDSIIKFLNKINSNQENSIKAYLEDKLN